MRQNNKRIGLLGLSADPPHCGHLEMARLLLGKRVVDEVWLIPCFAHSFGKPLSAPAHRWAMIKLLEEPGIKACNIEISRKKISYTIDTVRILKEKYPNCQFFWVTGSDIVRSGSFLRWKNWKALSFLTDFLMVLRKGYEIQKRYPGFTLVPGQISDVSSSEIRERIRHGLPVTGLVPPKVKEHIKKHNLYKD